MAAAARWMLATALGLGLAGSGLAEEASKPDASGYSLFNPTPDADLRDFAPDRPGKAHGTTTLDPGRFQLETELANYAYAPGQGGEATTRTLSIGAPMLKVGVASFVELQLQTALFNRLSQSDANGAMRATGFGDSAVGAKINLFGNGGGDQSMAFVAYAKIPTAARALGNGHPEYTFFLPYATQLPAGFSLTLEPGFGVLRRNDNLGYRQGYTFVSSLSHALFIPNLSGALEIASEWSSVRKDKTKVSLDPALQYALTKNLQIDAGLYIGLNKATPRYVAYTGFAYRF